MVPPPSRSGAVVSRMAWIRVGTALCVLGGLWPARPVAAAEATRVLSGLGAPVHGPFDDGFDFHLTLDWLMQRKQALVMRDFQSALSPQKSELVKDLVFRQTRQVLVLRGAAGLVRDVSLRVEAP